MWQAIQIIACKGLQNPDQGEVWVVHPKSPRRLLTKSAPLGADFVTWSFHIENTVTASVNKEAMAITTVQAIEKYFWKALFTNSPINALLLVSLIR